MQEEQKDIVLTNYTIVTRDTARCDQQRGSRRNVKCFGGRRERTKRFEVVPAFFLPNFSSLIVSMNSIRMISGYVDCGKEKALYC